VDESAFQDAVIARLKANTTLRVMLGSKGAPFHGIYRYGHKRGTPAFPFVTVEFGTGAGVTGSSEDVEQLVTIYVNGQDVKSGYTIEAIHGYINKMFNLKLYPLTGTNLRVHYFRRNGPGPTLFDEKLLVDYRPDIYLARYSLDNARLL